MCFALTNRNIKVVSRIVQGVLDANEATFRNTELVTVFVHDCLLNSSEIASQCRIVKGLTLFAFFCKYGKTSVDLIVL